MRFNSILPIALIICITLLISCTSGEQNEKETKDQKTYYGHSKLVLEKRCTDCHQKGGAAPFDLTNYDNVKKYGKLIIEQVEKGLMPPWKPDTKSCNKKLVGERSISKAEIKVLKDWLTDGSLEGNPKEFTKPNDLVKSQAINRSPDLKLGIKGSYFPDTKLEDDHRCFILDHKFENETFIQGSRVIPGNKETVHHVLVFVLDEDNMKLVSKLEGKDKKEGYYCFGNTGSNSNRPVAGWAPGSKAGLAPDNIGLRVPPGSRLVMQIHYNLVRDNGKPDNTQLELFLNPKRPEFLINSTPLPYFGFKVPPGDKSSTHSKIFYNNDDNPWYIVGLSPHMHTLGKRIKASKVNLKKEEECLIDIPNWDFNWQGGYRFLQGEHVLINKGEGIKLECTYDNSEENQLVVDGKRVAPKTVYWGSGTFDEMCLLYVSTLVPYSPIKKENMDCSGFQECYKTCKPSMTGCILQCASKISTSCVTCAITSYVTCGLDKCAYRADSLITCMEK